MTTTPITREAVEDFLFHEAELLDRWQLDAWASLFTDDGQYLVPPTDMPDGDPGQHLFLIYDDRHRLGERAKRLGKKTAHAEFPHSRTRHMISNVRIRQNGGDAVHATCNFVVYRSKQGVNDVYPGHSLYELVPGGDAGFRIRLKRATLDVETLRPQGKVSIIL
jgi:p-cumate 2,3-dioxygenase beta subunit